MIDKREYDQERLVPLVGMTASSAGNVYPDLIAMLSTIYRERVARLAWIPGDWLANVDRLHGAVTPDGIRMLVIPAPTKLANGMPTMGPIPAWLDTEEKRRSWNDLALVARKSVNDYVERRLVEGRAQLVQLYADAAFWDVLGRAAKAVNAAIDRGISLATDKVFSSIPIGVLLLMGVAAYFAISRGSHGTYRRNPPTGLRRARRRGRRVVRPSRR